VIGVTADANIYISGLEFGGTPLQFLSHARSGVFRLAVSPALLGEVSRVLRDKFGWQPGEVDFALERLARFTTLVRPAQTIDAVPSDPDDNRVLECAVEAGSEFVVTGDNDLLRLGSYGRIQIVRAAEFLKLLPTR
jgi:putative PIN family toxin of toxin-antitoxin system